MNKHRIHGTGYADGPLGKKSGTQLPGSAGKEGVKEMSLTRTWVLLWLRGPDRRVQVRHGGLSDKGFARNGQTADATWLEPLYGVGVTGGIRIRCMERRANIAHGGKCHNGQRANSDILLPCPLLLL